MASMRDQKKNGDEEDFFFATQLAAISCLPMAMKVAIELNVFEIISKAGPGGQMSPKSIASQLPTNDPDAGNKLDRIMRLLASYSILTSSAVTSDDGAVERLYGLASVCKYFVKNEDGVSLSPMLLCNQHKATIDSWYHMKEAILEGGVPFNKAHGMHAFEYPSTDPEFNTIFNTAMFSHSTVVMKNILNTYKGFEGLNQVIDIGGGVGTIINMITSNYSTIKGINFDLPHVIEHAPSYPGVEHVAGNMFDSVPNGEVIFMKWILHDWSDECCISLLKNCHKALPAQGKLIVVEGILPIAPENDTSAKSICEGDLMMLSLNPGGKERTEVEFDILGKKAGFCRMIKVCKVFNVWVMEFYKN